MSKCLAVATNDVPSSKATRYSGATPFTNGTDASFGPYAVATHGRTPRAQRSSIRCRSPVVGSSISVSPPTHSAGPAIIVSKYRVLNKRRIAPRASNAPGATIGVCWIAYVVGIVQRPAFAALRIA
jgi:hypothetical protein